MLTLLHCALLLLAWAGMALLTHAGSALLRMELCR